MKKLLIVFVLTSACYNTNSDYTWGDAVGELSRSFCWALATCGFAVSDNVEKWIDQCSAHTYFHICQIDNTCFYRLDESVEKLAKQCDRDLKTSVYNDPQSSECFALEYIGQVPKSCQELLKLDPKLQKDAGP